MKITGIEPILAGGRYLFVKVHTDEGLVGLGECGAWAYQEATVSVLKQMEKMILGQDGIYLERTVQKPALPGFRHPVRPVGNRHCAVGFKRKIFPSSLL